VIIQLNVFSQNVIPPSEESICLSKETAQKVIKDLIKYDGVVKELKLNNEKILILNQKIILKDSIILIQYNKIDNLNKLYRIKSEQLEISQKLSSKLETNLKIQKTKTKLYSGGGILGVILVAFIIK